MNASPPTLRTGPRELADWVLSIGGIDGVTLSGGDPLEQPLDALAEFLGIVRSQSSLSVLTFTGRTLAQLRASPDPAMARALERMDILIDGPYVEELNDGIGIRGSSNQRIHAIGPRAHGGELLAKAERRLELTVNALGRVSFTGIPARGIGRPLSQRLDAACAETRETNERERES